MRTLPISFHNPFRGKAGVLDAVAERPSGSVLLRVPGVELVGEADVEATVPRLEDRGIARGGGTLGRAVQFQVSGPAPALPLVVGERDRQATAAALGVVVDQRPP